MGAHGGPNRLLYFYQSIESATRHLETVLLGDAPLSYGDWNLDRIAQNWNKYTRTPTNVTLTCQRNRFTSSSTFLA
ncbi:unnamed protein product [Dovyalis caffra]|uniref:Uncharacterized protein n=1 Tax=Dovyalis caffra TaxID=77055 RepID=A0AAV1RXL9_9ROSI|nr:unnamed protein product [Dovyalis caffra]